MPFNYVIRHWTTATTMIGSSKDDALVVRVDDHAAVREAILEALETKGFPVQMASSWGGLSAISSHDRDWNYRSLVVHHAGKSHACTTPGGQQMRDIQGTHTASGKPNVGYHYAVGCDGSIFEARDIRYKGSHVLLGNTGRIGIVLLADLSNAGEAITHGPSIWRAVAEGTVRDGVREAAGQLADSFDRSRDFPSDKQMDATFVLCQTLKMFFPIRDMGGHREYTGHANDGRACPGEYGLVLAASIRRKLELGLP